MHRDADASVGHRHARLQDLLLDELRALFRDDISDPALADVVIAAVALSIDYRHARVHFLVHADARHVAAGLPNIEARLRRATPFLRARIGEALDLKRLPDLAFVFDAPDA